MTDAELFRAVLIEGAIGGALLSLIAFLLSRFTSDISFDWVVAAYIFIRYRGASDLTPNPAR